MISNSTSTTDVHMLIEQYRLNPTNNASPQMNIDIFGALFSWVWVYSYWIRHTKWVPNMTMFIPCMRTPIINWPCGRSDVGQTTCRCKCGWLFVGGKWNPIRLLFLNSIGMIFPAIVSISFQGFKFCIKTVATDITLECSGETVCYVVDDHWSVSDLVLKPNF